MCKAPFYDIKIWKYHSCNLGYAQVGFDRNGNADGHEKKPGKIHGYIVGSE